MNPSQQRDKLRAVSLLLENPVEASPLAGPLNIVLAHFFFFFFFFFAFLHARGFSSKRETASNLTWLASYNSLKYGGR